MPEPIRIAFLYSAPLVWQDADGARHPIDVLDFATERERVLDALSEACRAVETRIEPATADNLQTLLTLGCRILHYSGHGHPDFLAFESEDELGLAQRLAPIVLQNLCEKGKGRDLQVVFVSACHSRAAGEAFVKAGVKHVVAVRLEEPVYDNAAREFARHFYLALLTGRTVQQAFDSGRARVGALAEWARDDQAKFVLLPEYGYHDVPLVPELPLGRITERTAPLPPDNLPAAPQHFIGRSADEQRVVDWTANERLVTVRGAPGIGKTALATVAARYLHERRKFQEGVFWVPLRGALSAESTRAAIALSLDLTAQDDDELCRALRTRRLLLVLDNAEDPYNREPSGFRRLLEKLLQSAPRLHLLLTSRKPVGNVPSATEKVYTLRRLESRDAARLFYFARPRDYSEADWQEIAHFRHRSDQTTWDTFAHYPIFKILAGHPLAIRLAAQVLRDKALAQVRAALEAQPLETLRDPNLSEEEQDATTSLRASLKVSLDDLRQKNPDAVRLFAVLGLLPGGALSADLDAIWGQGWQPLMDVLVAASLVEREPFDGVEHFSTLPFVVTFAESVLTGDDRERFGYGVTEHFAQMSEAIYNSLGGVEATAGRALFAQEEENLRACLAPQRKRRVKRDDEEASPTGIVASYLLPLFQMTDRPHDGLRIAPMAIQACRAVQDVRGEANTLQSLGDLKVRLADLEGAQKEYAAALPIYREIQDRLGEANTHQSIGNLYLAQENPQAAFTEYRAALEIHSDIQDRLGLAADFGYMARAESAAGSHAQAVLLADESLNILREIGDQWGQALNLDQQAEGFWALEMQPSALGAWWLAREIFCRIDARNAKRLDGLFAQFEQAVGEAEWQKLAAELAVKAEEWRKTGVEVLKKGLSTDKGSG
jgi:tetratricopeptide (TPR) repeat protein